MSSSFKSSFLSRTDSLFLEHHPLPAWLVDAADLQIHFANKAAIELYKYPATEFSGKIFLDLFTAESREDFLQKRAHASEAVALNGPYRQVAKTGEVLWVDLFASALVIDNKNFYQLAALHNTAKNSVQQDIEEEVKRYKTYIENASAGIFCYEFRKPIPINISPKEFVELLRTDGVITECNQALAGMYGFTDPSALMGLQPSQLIDFDDPVNMEYFKSFVDNGFKALNAQSHEKDRNGYSKYFLKNAIGVVEGGVLKKIWGTQTDITRRKQAEQKLRQSEVFYRTLIADSLDGVLLLNEEGRISFCSPSVRHVLGYEAEEAEGRNGFEFVHPEDLDWAFQSFQKEVEERPEIKFITIRLLHKNGQWVWCMVRGHNLLSNPNINSLVVYFHDDTLRKQTSDALKESEKRFRCLIKDLQVGVFIFDKAGTIILCNKALSHMLSLPEEMIIGKNVYDILPDDMINEKEEPILQNERPLAFTVQSKQMVKEAVIGVSHPLTKERSWVMMNADPILDDSGDIKHVVCSVTDITSRKKLEQKLLADQISHQKQLTQATIDGQEAERREIGRELHDNIGQQLTTIKLFLDMVKSTADDVTIEMANMALKGVSDVINEIRSMSRALVPYTLKDLGLVESIMELVDAASRAQLTKIDFVYEDFEEELVPENQKLTLFRIVQEQLNNIAKHAEAKNVSIVIKNTDKKIFLEVKDDGKGFNPKKIRNGLGITNIRNRAELFGGSAQVLSQPGKGCTLKVALPVSPSPSLQIFNSYN